MSGLTAEQEANLQRLLAGANALPVHIERRADDFGSIDWIVYGRSGDVAMCCEMANPHARHNAKLIDAALNALPALLAELDRLRGEREWLRVGLRVALQLVALIGGRRAETVHSACTHFLNATDPPTLLTCGLCGFKHRNPDCRVRR